MNDNNSQVREDATSTTLKGAGKDHDGTPWAAIVILALGIFTMTTLEQMPIGVLTLVADDLGISGGAVGLGVTVPGLLAAVTAILAPRVTARLDRRMVLAVALFIAALSSFLTAVSVNTATYLGSRILVGLAIGTFWSLLGATVVRIAAKDQLSRALTIAFSGSAGAVVLGVPLSTWLGTVLGWQGSFYVGGAFSAVIGVGILLTLPKVYSEPWTGFGDFAKVWKIPGVRYGVIFTFLMVTAHFTAYTYASPLLQDLGGVTVEGVGVMLFAFGIAGLVGNFLAGPIMKRSMSVAVTLLPLGLLFGMAGLALVATNPTSAFLVMLGWGLFGGAISVVSQAWVLESADKLMEPAAGLASAAFNIGIALGAFAGGMAEGGFPGAPGILGGGGSEAILLTAVTGMAIALVVAIVGRRVSRTAVGTAGK